MIINKLNFVLYITGINWLFYYIKNLFSRRKFYIVTYHNIIRDKKNLFLFDMNNVSCDERTLDKQLRFFKSNFTVIPYSALESNLWSAPRNRPLLIITFDDGYQSFHDIAAPLFKKYGLPATVFIPTGYINTDRLPWWDEIVYICKSVTCQRFYEEAFEKYFTTDTELIYLLNSMDEKIFYKSLLSYLKRLWPDELDGFLQFVRLKFKTSFEAAYKNRAPIQFMTWQQVKELSEDGIEFCSHGVNHLQINLCNEEEIINELRLSRAEIERRLGKPVRVYCYPFGAIELHNASIFNILQEFGYKYACLMQYGYNYYDQHPYTHKRILIDINTPLESLAIRIRLPELKAVLEKTGLLFKKGIETHRKVKLATRLISHSFYRRQMNQNHATHLFFTICDHYEPYWNRASYRTAYGRLKTWLNKSPVIFNKHKDSDGRSPKYGFFYTKEEYHKVFLDMLSLLCKQGYGEVDIHHHHDNDSSEGLRKTLFDFKKRLTEKHGLLSIDNTSGDITYGFIHGNWALDNSDPSGRWCGVNDEITILSETGCYGDFTMPSAPHPTQTRKINSIYYAEDNPSKPKSHDSGRDARVGIINVNGLLLVQGPLCLYWKGLFPKIENGGINANNPPTKERVDLWIDYSVFVQGRPDWKFIKLYTHGTQENNIEMFFDKGGLDLLFTYLEDRCAEMGYILHYVSPRETVNIIHALEEGEQEWTPSLLNYRYKPIG